MKTEAKSAPEGETRQPSLLRLLPGSRLAAMKELLRKSEEA